MAISWRVQQQFFAPSESAKSDEVIRLPLTLLDQIDYWLPRAKSSTTSPDSLQAGFQRPSAKIEPPNRRANLWTAEEHDRFLRGLELFPRGPWKRVAAVVRTKTTRQTMTHAQKYRQKIERHHRITKVAEEVKPKPSLPESVVQPMCLWPSNHPWVVVAAGPSDMVSAPAPAQVPDSGCGELTDAELGALLECLAPVEELDAGFD